MRATQAVHRRLAKQLVDAMPEQDGIRVEPQQAAILRQPPNLQLPECDLPRPRQPWRRPRWRRDLVHRQDADAERVQERGEARAVGEEARVTEEDDGMAANPPHGLYQGQAPPQVHLRPTGLIVRHRDEGDIAGAGDAEATVPLLHRVVESERGARRGGRGRRLLACRRCPMEEHAVGEDASHRRRRAVAEESHVALPSFASRVLHRGAAARAGSPASHAPPRDQRPRLPELDALAIRDHRQRGLLEGRRHDRWRRTDRRRVTNDGPAERGLLPRHHGPGRRCYQHCRIRGGWQIWR
mmetsp:Transcript_25499/g.73371  ORF Transcript_25499/g.73371 Transcript_25499/m.73371 type:complete len:297 (-) Transcript_25499:54-944(-)